MQETTIAGHLSAIKYYHRLVGGIELDTQHPLIRNALKGVTRGHAEVGTQQRLRLPVSWAVLQAGAGLVPTWGVGGRLMFLALGASFFFLTGASEMFAMSVSHMHAAHGLRRGDVAFFAGSVQLILPTRWPLADRVEVRFRYSKGDQLRKGAVLTRVRSGPYRPVEAGGGAVACMVELLLYYPSLPSHSPLVAVGADGDRWMLLKRRQAESALRDVVSLAGLQPAHYALHSLRIGGATHLAAGGGVLVSAAERRALGRNGWSPILHSKSWG